ncbi:MAG: PAS domain-containing protein [Deltaproteobacteria bacterium]|nr:PAS domain-containing protein [Deltaproteobacteria bacterium]
MLDKAIMVTYYVDPPFFTRKSVNEEYCRFYNVRPEQVIGRSCLETTPEKNRNQVQKKIEACVENDAVLVTIEPTMMPDGTASLIRWVEAPVKDRTGKIIEVVAVGLPLQDRRGKKDRRQTV